MLNPDDAETPSASRTPARGGREDSVATLARSQQREREAAEEFRAEAAQAAQEQAQAVAEQLTTRVEVVSDPEGWTVILREEPPLDRLRSFTQGGSFKLALPLVSMTVGLVLWLSTASVLLGVGGTLGLFLAATSACVLLSRQKLDHELRLQRDGHYLYEGVAGRREQLFVVLGYYHALRRTSFAGIRDISLSTHRVVGDVTGKRLKPSDVERFRHVLGEWGFTDIRDRCADPEAQQQPQQQ